MVRIDIEPHPTPGFAATGSESDRDRYYPEASTIEVTLQPDGRHADRDRGEHPGLTSYEEWVVTHEMLHAVHDATTAMQYLFLMNVSSLWAYRGCLDAVRAGAPSLGHHVAYLLIHETVMNDWRRRARICLELHAQLTQPPGDEFENYVRALQRRGKARTTVESVQLVMAANLLEVQQTMGERPTRDLVTGLIRAALSPPIFGDQQVLTAERRAHLDHPPDSDPPSFPISYPDDRLYFVLGRFLTVFREAIAPDPEVLRTHQEASTASLTHIARKLFEQAGYPVVDPVNPSDIGSLDTPGVWPDFEEDPPADDLRHPHRPFAAAKAALAQPKPLGIIVRSPARAPEHRGRVIPRPDLTTEQETSFKALYLQTRIKNRFVANLLDDRLQPGFGEDVARLCPQEWAGPEVDLLRTEGRQLLDASLDPGTLREIDAHYARLRDKLPAKTPVSVTTMWSLLVDGRFIVPVS